MSASPKHFFTPEEYLELECKADYKSQYVAGEIFAMPGTQPVHNILAGNIHASLHGQFRERPCFVFIAGMRVRVQGGDMYSYPDVAALCGEPRFEAVGNPPSLINRNYILYKPKVFA